jgi:hypothetical protein
MKTFLFFVLLFSVSFSITAQDATQAEPQTGGDPLITDRDIKNFPVTTGSAANSASTYTRPTSKQRLKRYGNSMFGPVALAKTVVSAGYSTWRNSPEEWKPTWEGFGRRFASGVGKNVIKQTTIYGLGEAFKLDSAFYKSEKKNVGGRLGDALLSTFVARKPDGTKVFGFPRIAGTYTSSIIAAEVWYPNRFDYKDGLKSGTISLGLNTAFNVFKEFFFKK